MSKKKPKKPKIIMDKVTSESLLKEHRDIISQIEGKYNKAVDMQDHQTIYFLAVLLNALSSWLFSSLGPGSDPPKGRKITLDDFVKSEPWGQA